MRQCISFLDRTEELVTFPYKYRVVNLPSIKGNQLYRLAAVYFDGFGEEDPGPGLLNDSCANPFAERSHV
jgi:hypothetical protein